MSHDNAVSAVHYIQRKTRCKYDNGHGIEKATIAVSPWNDNIKLLRISVAIPIYPTVLHKPDASPFKYPDLF
jgi:hypothetical protein